MRTPFSLRRQVQLALNWYGDEFEFVRSELDEFNEPIEESVTHSVNGIYHSSSHEFVELINQEGISVKTKINKGILCSYNLIGIDVQQNDEVTINDILFKVTAVEPILYNNQVVAHEISLEEFVEGIES